MPYQMCEPSVRRNFGVRVQEADVVVRNPLATFDITPDIEADIRQLDARVRHWTERPLCFC
jgi:hypothetical protein